MSSLRLYLKRSGLPLLLVLCLAALSVSYAYADEAQRPLAVQIIGDPDAAVNGRFAVGTGSVGSKALTVVGVIDFLGAGTVHNYFTQGTGNNMQINTNVDEANVVGDASRSQWKLVLGSSLDWFSIRRSPAGATYDEDALFFIEGSTGRVGIATVDTANAAAIPFTLGARLHVDTPTGDAIYGITNEGAGQWTGVYGQSASTEGNGVIGRCTATTGETWGVGGLVRSDSGIGVVGANTATSGNAYGVRGASWSPEGAGVLGWGLATAGYNAGVLGVSDSTDGYGVVGWAGDATGTNYGIYGASASTEGRGVYGWATATTGTNYGIYGESDSPSGYAGYFEGNVHVAGTLSKSAGGFHIDHPLDPANRYLNHSFVESSDMMNLYDGLVTLDDDGQAWVQLPDWFEALNQDFRYQLTPMGQFAPLYIAQGIQDNRFLIAGGAPGMQVCWQVTGIRHDAYAEAHRIPVEEDKPAEEQGTYLFPELYGQPAGLGLNFHLPEEPTVPSAPDAGGRLQ